MLDVPGLWRGERLRRQHCLRAPRRLAWAERGSGSGGGTRTWRPAPAALGGALLFASSIYLILNSK